MLLRLLYLTAFVQIRASGLSLAPSSRSKPRQLARVSVTSRLVRTKQRYMSCVTRKMRNIIRHWLSLIRVIFFCLSIVLIVLFSRDSILVDEEFRAIKTRSKAALEESREVVQNSEEDLREQYNEIETKRAQYDRDLAEAEARGTTPPSAEGVDVRTVDELQAELDRQQAKLELNLNTNPGVVEQYEKRKRDVSNHLICVVIAMLNGACGVGVWIF